MALYLGNNMVDMFGGIPINVGFGMELLATYSVGEENITATSATDLSKSVYVPNADSYDLLIVMTYCQKTNSRHWCTIGLIELYNTTDATSRTSSSISTNKYNYKVTSDGTVQSRCGTTAYGIYPYSCSVNNKAATINLYGRYNNNSTGTINGTYTTKVYGARLYNWIGE